MKLKHDFEINTSNPFKNCKLGREKYAKVLTNIVENYPDGFVIAINNKWGSGKTTFVKMWEQDLKNLDYKTIYFNAWENDFEGNPLVAMLAEMKVINPNEEESFNKVMKNAAKISKNIIPSIAISFLKKYIDSETILNGIKDTSNTIIEIFEDDINEYSKRKKSIEDFKKSLSQFVAEESKGKQLIFIIDELDRCRPTYSVQLLEQIKHFFSIPNIIFVLSIDKIQLENAVCGVYGSEKN
jgi:predicted KAP-like P-loop ATPase